MYNTDIQTYFSECPRIIVIGDVHGDLGRLTECLYATKVINQNGEWIAEPKNTIVVQLGDQVDSLSRGGPDGWEKLPDTDVLYFMDKLDHTARLHGGRVLSLIGNHELMNVLGDFNYVSKKSMGSMGEQLRRVKFSPGGTLATLLSKRCVVLKIGPCLFVHGGILPHHVNAVNNNLHALNEVTRKFLRKEELSPEEQAVLTSCVIGEQGLLWTRAYMELTHNEQVLEMLMTEVLKTTDAKMVCVGHNTVSRISPLCKGKLWMVDAALSRSYGNPSFQVLEILDNGETFRVNEIQQNT
jgi:hypothetical protein